MKIMASDFDGTLFYGWMGEGFKEEDLKAIEKFRKEGNLFGVCTGRPLEGVLKYTKGILDFDFYILTSGAVIFDKDLNVICENKISDETTWALHKEYASRYGNAWIHANHTIYVLKASENVGTTQEIVKDYSEIPANTSYGVSFKTSSIEEAAKVCKEVNEKYPDVEAHQNIEYVDISARGVSKGSALENYLQQQDAKQVYGIGDSFNDISLLERADVSFTFNRAPEIVKNKVHHLVDSVADAIKIIM